MGIKGGYRGLLYDELIPLTSRDVSNTIFLSGTFLYSDRCDKFKEEEGMQKAIETLKKHEIDGIVAIGGDGTFRGATDLSIRGIPTIGVPGTIDNDITATDNTIGFADAITQYDAAWFAEHDLLMVVLEEGSGSIRHEVYAITKTPEKWSINIASIEPEVCTADMAQWHILIEVEKDLIDVTEPIPIVVE